jgi:hypothetical protein
MWRSLLNDYRMTERVYDEYVANYSPVSVELTVDGEGRMEPKKLQAVQTLNEILYRLQLRYRALKSTENRVYETATKQSWDGLTELQQEYVNCIESYYQQLYSAISALANFVNIVAAPNYRRGMSGSSIKRFLEFLRSSPNLDAQGAIDELEKARDFRAKIDHIQMQKGSTWMTYAYPSKTGYRCVVIYYTKNGNEVYHRCQLNPYSPEFTPPVNYSEYYVSPPHDEAHAAVFCLCQKIISSLVSNHT